MAWRIDVGGVYSVIKNVLHNIHTLHQYKTLTYYGLVNKYKTINKSVG